MNQNTDHPSTKRNSGTWVVLGAVLIVALYIGGGLWLLSRPSGTSTAVAIHDTPTPIPTEHATTETRPSATSSAIDSPLQVPTVDITLSSPLQIPPTPTVEPSPTPGPAPTTAALASGDLFELAVIHSNDTWGYTLPCG